ncbi:MAG: NAD(P)/FAD-dependent oxidoreductase [Eubacteriales bacterium]|nr:NAD(P)/FAD-dependent oxidoreductase [Eubacteriales bacterium]
MYDVAIIGAGVVGSCLAYECSRYQLKVLLLEKENDVALGASRANTAIVHGGYDPDPQSLMGKYNVEGAYLTMDQVEKLDVEFIKTGSLIVGFDEQDAQVIKEKYERGLVNGVKGMQILDGDQAREREPNLSKDITIALWVPDSGVINPWEFTLAHAEVAVREGVELKLKQEVTGLSWQDDHYIIETPEEEFTARYVVNCAGTHADEIHEMVAEPAFKIEPTRGQYYVLDRAVGEIVKTVIFPCPNEFTKGILVSPTIHGNILVGPDAEIIEDKENTATTAEGLGLVARDATRCVPDLNLRSNIRNYAGVRANSDYGDFYLKIVAPNFLDIAAIKSPGLTCAPVLAQEGIKLLESEGLVCEAKDAWDGNRKVVRFKEIPDEEREDFIAAHPEYGRVICRCETITEGEIIASLKRGIPVVSIDGVKRRTGTGMGRCQGGFCGPRIVEILCRETGICPEDIVQDKAGSYILCGPTKTSGKEE